MISLTRKNEDGFSAVEWLLLLVILAIVALAGYKVYTSSNTTNNLNDQSASQQVAQPATFNSTSDLTKAEEQLDQVNPDDNNADSAQLDSQLSGF